MHRVGQALLQTAYMNDGHDARPGQHADDAALSAREAAAADDHVGDVVELKTHGDGGIAHGYPRELHHVLAPGERTGNRIHGDFAPDDPNATETGCPLVGADREE